MQMASSESTGKSLECPSCRRRFDADEVADRGRGYRCPRCGSTLVVAGRLLEIAVRKRLYGERSPVVHVLGPEGARPPTVFDEAPPVPRDARM